VGKSSNVPTVCCASRYIRSVSASSPPDVVEMANGSDGAFRRFRFPEKLRGFNPSGVVTDLPTRDRQGLGAHDRATLAAGQCLKLVQSLAKTVRRYIVSVATERSVAPASVGRIPGGMPQSTQAFQMQIDDAHALQFAGQQLNAELRIKLPSQVLAFLREPLFRSQLPSADDDGLSPFPVLHPWCLLAR
jgi:hypothetical protein